MLEDTFANRLKYIMRIKDIKATELSVKTKIAKSQISHWLSGTYKAKQDSLTVLAEFFDVNEAWLMGFDVPMQRVIDNEPVDDNIYYDEIKSPVVRIPILGKVPAGIPIEAIQDILGYEDIPAQLVKNGERYFALKVSGDSMYPEYKSNDVIIVKQQADCNSGDDCVVLVNGYDATFKRIIKETDGIKLKPLNNDFETMKYSNQEIATKPIVIVGVAVEVRRKLKSK